MSKETNNMLDIIHNNCKKEQERRITKEQYEEEQEYGKKWCRRILITGIICVILEVATVIIERMV